MKNFYFFLIVAMLSVCCTAQTARDEIKADINRSGSNLYAYPGPQKPFTPAPADKKPFYITHYGRHGSRFLCGTKEYTSVIDILQKADELGKMTPFGKDVLRRICIMNDEAHNRAGELTPLGAQQHKDIARRMFERCPEVFADSAVVDARSTIVIRCILSMENALHQLIVMNPKLQVKHDASYHDMYYMNLGHDWVDKYRLTKESKDEYQKWARKHCSPDRLMKAMFNDKKYVRDSINATRLVSDIFKIVSINQNQETRKTVNMYDIFTEEEIYNHWERNNILWYLGFTGNKYNYGLPPYVQRNLLKDFITKADSCLLLEHPGATLRYGHETMVLPLSCLMELNDNNSDNISSISDIADNWRNYSIFPMGANIQLIFYRKDINDRDILVKALMNEDEVTLPVPTDCAPYYHWKDVREYYIHKLDEFEKNTPALQDKVAKQEWKNFWDNY